MGEFTKVKSVLVKDRNKDKDCRAISDDFLNEFKSGKYKAFLELVKKYNDELVLCFRGNNGNSVTSEAVCIYYNNHVVYKIEKSGKITISFNHARYSEEYKDFWEKITQIYGFIPNGKRGEEKIPEVKVSKGGSVGIGEVTGRFKGEMYVSKSIENVYKNCLRPMMIDFFDSDKTKDYFRITANEYPEHKGEMIQTESWKKEYLEKIRQQQLFHIMKSTQNGYFVFDMEFSQKTMNNKDCYGHEVGNRPDMLAVRFDQNGKPCAYVFVEVKCTKGAYEGKSGFKQHLDAMEKYPEKYMEARCREAALIISQYRELGLYQFPENIEEEDYKNLSEKIEILFIFTDEAVLEFEKDTELKDQYELRKLENMEDIHLPGCKRVEIVEFNKKKN